MKESEWPLRENPKKGKRATILHHYLGNTLPLSRHKYTPPSLPPFPHISSSSTFPHHSISTIVKKQETGLDNSSCNLFD